MQCGPVCYTAQHPVGAVCQLEARPECNRNGCTPTPLGQSLRVRIPTILLDWQLPQEGQGGESTSVADSYSVEVPGMVPSAPGIAGGLPTEPVEQPSATDRSIRQSSPPDGSRSTTTSRLEVIRQQQQAAGISEVASKLLAAGWSKGTNSTYQSAWKRCASWCHEWQVNPISCSVQFFIEFLTALFKKGMQY